MNADHETLYRTLKALMAAIEAGDGDALKTHLAALESERQALDGEAPPMLRHYLEKRSYAKALAFLEGTDPEAEGRPNC